MIYNKFVFIISFRNVKDYIKQCAESLIAQEYQNWVAIFCDDNSNDYSISYIPKEDRFVIRSNEERITALPNIHNALVESSLHETDIVCILDGDDYLLNSKALTILNELYQDQTLVTYGQYVRSDGGIGHCFPYSKQQFINLRQGGFRASHLKSFRYLTYKELCNQDPDLTCFKDVKGQFYKMSCDVAIMTPLLEIAGFDNVKFNSIPIYYYRTHDNNDHVINSKLQTDIANEIFAKSRFKETLYRIIK